MRHFIRKYRGGIAFAALMWALAAAVYILSGWWLFGMIVLLFLAFDAYVFSHRVSER